jgi:hypothetical protein
MAAITQSPFPFSNQLDGAHGDGFILDGVGLVEYLIGCLVAKKMVALVFQI